MCFVCVCVCVFQFEVLVVHAQTAADRAEDPALALRSLSQTHRLSSYQSVGDSSNQGVTKITLGKFMLYHIP
jgi:hypothetical protein